MTASEKAKAIKRAVAVFETGCSIAPKGEKAPEECRECSEFFVKIVADILSKGRP